MHRFCVALLFAAADLLYIAFAWGLDFAQLHSTGSQKYLIETLSGSAALLDYGAAVPVPGSRPVVLMSRPNAHHWLRIKLEGKRSNRMGIVAKGSVDRQDVYVTSSGSYLSASDSRVHFGLGTATEAVVWPSGQRQRIEHVRSDREIEIREPWGSTQKRLRNERHLGEDALWEEFAESGSDLAQGRAEGLAGKEWHYIRP